MRDAVFQIRAAMTIFPVAKVEPTREAAIERHAAKSAPPGHGEVDPETRATAASAVSCAAI
jgi:hypothetical protein